jgi:quinol monooxygenase YgiN
MPRVVIHATIVVKPELVDDYKKVMKDVIRGSLQEEGCEYYVGTYSAQHLFASDVDRYDFTSDF